MSEPKIVVAGATGNLGRRIVCHLLAGGADVRAVVRSSTPIEKVEELRARGVAVVGVDYDDAAGMAEACSGASCIVSALSGLREVIVDAQTSLLDAAVASGVQRFIPSDYCIDFTKLESGTNRNFDLRREFRERLDVAPIAATSILCGMFADMLTGKAPIILFKLKRVLYWQNADQLLDFTTIDDAARFTAQAALDPATPRFLCVAGDQISARGLVTVASEVSGEQFTLFRGGSLGRLRRLMKVVKTIAPGGGALYPPWQGMQYLHNMFGGRAKLTSLDNDRYPRLRWTTVREVLAEHLNRVPTDAAQSH
ncbi:MAG: NmrA family NAD(P)-binding protein [Gemmatimonadaceae bacterium]